MKHILEAKSITKVYRQQGRDVPAMQDISFAVGQNDIYGIIGLSGAGKSTLLRTLAGLIKPTSGEVFLNGEQIDKLPGPRLREIRTSMGMIFQHFNLLSSRDVAKNISYPLEIAGVLASERERRINELLTLVGLSHHRHSFPSELSGGQKQRVGIARALANHPKILFCDEATSALDPKTTREILDLLKSIHAGLGLTLVLITHDMEVIKRICSKVAVLDQGRIVEEGSVADVFAAPKHPMTQRLIQATTHELPEELLKSSTPDRKVLRLRFKGKAASEPLMAYLALHFNVEPNILLGWIDQVQSTVIGVLVIELKGPPEGIDQSLNFLSQHEVHCEVLERGN